MRRLLPDTTLLQCFECAARHGNFSRAAEELHLTQSAVSRQIRELEVRTGLRLFERIRQRVVLSDAGARLLPQVRQWLSEGEALMLQALSAEQEGVELKVATLPTFGVRWLVPRLGDFTRQHPNVQLTMVSRDRPFNLEEEDVDLAIHYGQPIWAGAVSRFLCSEEVVPVASRDLAARLGEDLGEATLLHLTTRPRLWAQWFERAGLSDDAAWRGTRFDQFSMIIAAVSAGLGVGLLPSYLIESEIARGDLVALSDQPMATDNAYWMILPEGGQAHRPALQFRDWLLTQVPPPREPLAAGGVVAANLRRLP